MESLTDYVNPPLVCVEGRNYRVLCVDQLTLVGEGDGGKRKKGTRNRNGEEYERQQEQVLSDLGVELVDNSGGEPQRDGMLVKGDIVVTEDALKMLVNGEKKKKQITEIEEKSGTAIELGDSEGSPVVGVSGNEKAGVVRAIGLINSIFLKAPPTHFLSVPLNCEDVIHRMEMFADTVTGPFKHICPPNIKNLLQKPKRIHLTIVMMNIYSPKVLQARISKFRKEIPELWRKIVQKSHVRLKLRGLDCFGSPSKARVVFTGPNHEHPDTILLQKFFDAVSKLFGGGPVKIHGTILNTTFDSKSRVRQIDASAMFEHFKDFDFGEIEVNALHFSKRFCFEENGFYFSEDVCEFS
eukprot:Nk52_evm70s2657 gene=Nk52_evmTU70s2657